MRDEEMNAEIEDFLEGFNQPTYRGMRIYVVVTLRMVGRWPPRVGRGGVLVLDQSAA
jgi:hypothetical protein